MVFLVAEKVLNARGSDHSTSKKEYFNHFSGVRAQYCKLDSGKTDEG